MQEAQLQLLDAQLTWQLFQSQAFRKGHRKEGVDMGQFSGLNHPVRNPAFLQLLQQDVQVKSAGFRYVLAYLRRRQLLNRFYLYQQGLHQKKYRFVKYVVHNVFDWHHVD
ncbi:hypothetical protein D3C71_716900 [compost metagenome]